MISLFMETLLRNPLITQENIKKMRRVNLYLRNEKCFLMFNEGVFLGNHVSFLGIKVDPHKVEVIVNLPPPYFQRDVRSF